MEGLAIFLIGMAISMGILVGIIILQDYREKRRNTLNKPKQ